MKLTGLDLSLTSTGLAHWYLTGRIVTETVQPKVSRDRQSFEHARLDYLLAEVGGRCRNTDLVALEGPSFGSPNKQHALGGLWWLVAHGLYRRHIPYVVVTPQQRAKYITGKGGAGKVAVAMAVARRYPWVELEGDDEADALVLAAMLADYLGLPGVSPPPKDWRAVLGHISWPPEFEEAKSAQAAAIG